MGFEAALTKICEIDNHLPTGLKRYTVTLKFPIATHKIFTVCISLSFQSAMMSPTVCFADK